MSKEEKEVQAFLEMNDEDFKKEWKDLPMVDKIYTMKEVKAELS